MAAIYGDLIPNDLPMIEVLVNEHSPNGKTPLMILASGLQIQPMTEFDAQPALINEAKKAREDFEVKMTMHFFQMGADPNVKNPQTGNGPRY